jgi:hypothetical protein
MLAAVTRVAELVVATGEVLVRGASRQEEQAARTAHAAEEPALPKDFQGRQQFLTLPSLIASRKAF